MFNQKKYANSYRLSQQHSRQFIKERYSTIYGIFFISVLLILSNMLCMIDKITWIGVYINLVAVQMFMFYLLFKDLKKVTIIIKKEDEEEFDKLLENLRSEKNNKIMKGEKTQTFL